MAAAQCRKQYVAVNLDVDEEGEFHPRMIFWRNGRSFKIDRMT